CEGALRGIAPRMSAVIGRHPFYFCHFSRVRTGQTRPCEREFGRSNRDYSLRPLRPEEHRLRPTIGLHAPTRPESRRYVPTSLILKAIARVAGLHSPDACVLAFPRSLEELDRKSSEFCPSDHSTLVAAGILKEKESQQGNDCLDIALKA